MLTHAEARLLKLHIGKLVTATQAAEQDYANAETVRKRDRIREEVDTYVNNITRPSRSRRAKAW